LGWFYWSYKYVSSNFEKTEMIKENSGKIYRFKLDHNQGYGFAEIYDFTDFDEFDGRIIYVYNLIDEEPKTKYDLENINKSGIAIGPIRMMDFPGTRGKYASKYIGQRNDLLVNEIPVTKELKGIIIDESNWNNFKSWYRSDYLENGELKFSRYSELRNLETRILSSIVSVTIKFTMKKIIDNGKDVAEYYDLNEIGNYNMFIQLINTYYSLEKATELLSKTKNPYKKQNN
jgi:hypothetical protein